MDLSDGFLLVGLLVFFFSFSSAILASAVFSHFFIQRSSSASEATGSVKYSSTIFQPALERSAILMSLFRFLIFLIVALTRFLERPLVLTSSNSPKIPSLNSYCSLLELYFQDRSFFLVFFSWISFTRLSIMSRSNRLRCLFVGETLRSDELSPFLETDLDLGDLDLEDRDLDGPSEAEADCWDGESRRRGIFTM